MTFKPEILKKEIQDFLSLNIDKDLKQLAFSIKDIGTVNKLEIITQLSSKKKCQSKLPSWFAQTNIYYPQKVNVEQTSSEQTAAYKASLIEGAKIVDITGGFGVDCYYFSNTFAQVIHCEKQESLSKIAAHNFKTLGKNNIECQAMDGLHYLEESKDTFDWIYCDPSRRNEVKGKVFLLEDCEPNLITNRALLFTKAQKILVKVSPLLDIKNTLNSLKNVKEIHCVALKNEMKELLFVLEKGYSSTVQVCAVNLIEEASTSFQFSLDTEYTPSYSLPKKYLYEPNVAILKSGGFYAVSVLYKINKLEANSHLYTSDKLITFPGRSFKIIAQIPYNKKKILTVLPEKKANITTRNFPESVAQIRKKTGIKDGGNTYLFFTTDCRQKKIVLLCEKLG